MPAAEKKALLAAARWTKRATAGRCTNAKLIRLASKSGEPDSKARVGP